MKNKIKSILEASINDLIQSGDRVQKNHIEEPGGGIININFRYEHGTKRFLIWGLYAGTTDNYPFKIDFLRVRSEEVTSPEDLQALAEQDFEINVPYVQKDHRFLFITNDNKAFFIDTIDANSDDVQVRCGCNSYAYSYYKGNKQSRSATGPAISRPVKGTGKPKPVVAGACKHLQIIFSILQETGIVE